MNAEEGRSKMPVKNEKGYIPLSKRRLLEFLGAQKRPITAKAASIDLDTRASTVTEMLERCAAQGLVEREANQRPREYTITEAGRRSLELFSPSEDESERESAEAETDAIPREGSTKLRALIDRLNKLLEAGAECEDMPESADETKAEPHSEVIRDLYRAQYELRSLGFFDSKNEVRARIAQLETTAGKDAAEQLERLVSLEREIRGDSNPETLRAVLELRDALHLPASVFGHGPKAYSDDE